MPNVLTARNGVSLAQSANRRILEDLTKPAQPTVEELLARIAQLEAAQKSSNKLSLRVSEKGALSIYGLGRFPITLYLSQFEKLNAAWPEVQQFVDANRSRFTTKD